MVSRSEPPRVIIVHDEAPVAQSPRAAPIGVRAQAARVEAAAIRHAAEAKQAAARDKMLAAALSFASNGSPTAAMAALLAASCVGLTGTARCRRERYVACFMRMAVAEMKNFAAAESALPLLAFSDDDDDDDSDEAAW